MTANQASHTSVADIKNTADAIRQALFKNGITLKDPNIFKIIKMYPAEFKFLLDVQNIKYRELKKTNLILIEKSDYDKCLELENANITKGRFRQEFVNGELKDYLKRIKKSNKMFTLSGLPSSIEQSFLNNVSHIKSVILLEHTSYDNDTFSISIPQDGLNENERRALIKAYFEAVVINYGVNMENRVFPELPFTIKNYEDAVSEQLLINKIDEYVTAKLDVSSLTIDNIEDYFKSYVKEASQVLTELPVRNTAPDISNSQIVKEHMQELNEIFKAFSDLQYKYAVKVLDKQLFVMERTEKDKDIEVEYARENKSISITKEKGGVSR